MKNIILCSLVLLSTTACAGGYNYSQRMGSTYQTQQLQAGISLIEYATVVDVTPIFQTTNFCDDIPGSNRANPVNVVTGAVIGAAVGHALGGEVGNRNSKRNGAILGAGAGAYIASQASQPVYDQQCTQHRQIVAYEVTYQYGNGTAKFRTNKPYQIYDKIQVRVLAQPVL